MLKRGAAVLLRPLLGASSRTGEIEGPIERILVIRQHDQLGDMLCAIPLLRSLRLTFPRARITLVASPVNFDIMLHHPYADEVLNYDKALLRRSPAALAAFYRSIRSAGRDLAIVPATVSLSTTSDLLARLSGARLRVGAGSLDGRRNPMSFCFNRVSDLEWGREPHRHQALRNLDILRPLGMSCADLGCVLGFTADESAEARAFLADLRSQTRFLVGIHPGAGKEANRWPAPLFASLANRIAGKFSCGIVVTAGYRDAEPLRIIRQQLTCPHAIVQDQPIRRVAAIIDQTDFFISNDTGMMHVAGATRAGLLALFGPTDPLQWAPIGPKNRYVVADDGIIASIPEDLVFETLSSMVGESALHSS